MSERNDRAAEVLAGVKTHAETRLGEIWWAILLRGVLALGLAVCALVWPQQTLGILIKLLGAYFLIDGVIGAVGSYRSGDRGPALMQAVVSLTIGLVLLLWTGVSARLFLILIGIWLLLQGASLVVSSRTIDPERGERGLTGIIGGIMALIGIMFVVWPDTGIVTISWLIAMGALVIGCLLVYLATRVKRLKTRIDGIGVQP